MKQTGLYSPMMYCAVCKKVRGGAAKVLGINHKECNKSFDKKENKNRRILDNKNINFLSKLE